MVRARADGRPALPAAPGGSAALRAVADDEVTVRNGIPVTTIPRTLLDGRAAHHTARNYERDRARDRRLQARGWRVVRVTWGQLERDADKLARDLDELLRRPAGASA